MRENTQQEPDYQISDDLLRALENDYPNILPTYEPTAFDLGKLVGAIDVITKIKMLTHPKVYELDDEPWEEG